MTTLTPPTEAPALTRGMQILKQVAATSDGLAFSQIIDSVDAPRATLARLLRVLLAQRDLIKSDRDGRYRIGPGMTPFTQGGNTPLRLETISRPLLREISQQMGHTLLLIYFDEQNDPFEMVCLAKAQHEDSLAMQPEGRRTRHVDHNPWGWLYYYQHDPHQRKELLIDSKNQSTFRKRWTEQEQFIRKYDFALDKDSNKIGFLRLAIPVRNDQNRVVAAIGMGAANKALPKSAIIPAGRALAHTAHQIERAMGWRSA